MTDKNPWADIIGPCCSAISLARTLAWTESEVSAAAASLTVLYPAFQVWEGRVVPGLAEVLQVLRTGTSSRWAWAQWLNAQVDDESGEDAPSAIEQLQEGRLDEVLLDARHTAWAWSS